MLSLLLAFALGPNLFSPGDEQVHASSWSDPDTVPAEAMRALRQGRYWRASKILRGYLAVAPDTSPESILLVARADAGWGNWSAVERLLDGRSWLDTTGQGTGWDLLGRSRLAQGRWAAGEHALSRYLAVAAGAGDEERGLAEARRARALVQSGDPAAAVPHYRQAAQALPLLGDWLDIFGADAAAHAGDTAAVRALLARTDPTLAREWGWRSRVRGRTVAGDLAGALAAAESAANTLGEARRRAEAWAAAGDLRLRRGDRDGARAAYRRAIAAAPLALAALDAARSLQELGELTPDDHLRIGRLYLQHGNVARGLAGLQAYLDAGRGTPLEQGQLKLEMGRALFRAARYAEAERDLLALAAAAPSTRIAADALFLAARAQYRQGRVAPARATLRRTADQFPQESAATEALYLLGDLDHDNAELQSAREYYRRAAAGRASVNEADLARMRLGGLAYQEGDYRGASRIFEEYRARHPTGRRVQQATYWAARAYAELGDQADARTRFREVRRLNPFSWYGLRAAEHLGEEALAIPMEPAPAQNDRIAGAVDQALKRIELLQELDARDAVEYEVERAKRHFDQTDGASYALAEAFNERGHTVTGIRLGWDIYRREGAWNPRLLRIIYPFPYRELIVAEARERGLDPFFVAGLIRQESTFSARIKSPVGAVGLMQIMPATGKSLARGAGLKEFDPELLENAELNVHLGTTYLAELLARYGNRAAPALAAYNAGPHRLTFWSTFPEYADDELFAERIPFAETREYVKIVQQNARLYAALYPGEPGLGGIAPAGAGRAAPATTGQ
jgi:soluble lytic murein transglycosylase